MRNLILLILLVNCFQNHASSEFKTPVPDYKPSGFMDFNGYYDTRGYSVYTFNLLANISPKFQYFSLTNLWGASHNTDLGSFYSEQNLRFQLGGSPFKLTYQHVLRGGDINDSYQLGLMLQIDKLAFLAESFKKINTFLFTNVHFTQYGNKQSPNYLPLIEYVYGSNWKIAGLKMYIFGFMDQNISYHENKMSFKYVTEHQLGIQIAKNTFAVIEYRINDYITDPRGFGLGLQYKATFK